MLQQLDMNVFDLNSESPNHGVSDPKHVLYDHNDCEFKIVGDDPRRDFKISEKLMNESPQDLQDNRAESHTDLINGIMDNCPPITNTVVKEELFDSEDEPERAGPSSNTGSSDNVNEEIFTSDEVHMPASNYKPSFKPQEYSDSPVTVNPDYKAESQMDCECEDDDPESSSSVSDPQSLSAKPLNLTCSNSRLDDDPLSVVDSGDLHRTPFNQNTFGMKSSPSHDTDSNHSSSTESISQREPNKGYSSMPADAYCNAEQSRFCWCGRCSTESTVSDWCLHSNPYYSPNTDANENFNNTSPLDLSSSRDKMRNQQNSQSGKKNPNSKIHSQDTNEKPHECEQCGKHVASAGQLKRHMLTHIGDKHLDCSECGKHFQRSRDMFNHMLVHTGEKPHVCGDCGSSFARESSLKRHMLIHGGVKTHECMECGKKFFRRSYLKIHLDIHSGLKPHGCSVCGKHFAQQGKLKLHMMTHSGDKPHQCEECGKEFCQKGDLRVHMFTHSGQKPQACGECGKRFAHHSALKRHSLLHSGEKPHCCNECGKHFTRISNLRAHELTHTKPFACNDCDKQFSNSRALKNHLLNHKNGSTS